MSFQNTPSGENLVLGAGEILFDRFDAAGLSTGYRHVGNAESLNITTTVETIEKKSSMDGARGIIAQAVIGSESEVVIVLNEYHPENLALALQGDTGTYAQTAAAGLVAQPVNGGVAVKFERWYQLEKSAGGNAKKVSNLVVKQGVTTLVLNDDYVVDLELGLIKVLESGALATEAVTTWEGDVAAITAGAAAGGVLVRGLSVGKIEGRLKYKSAANQAKGPRFEVDVHKIQLQPDGELPFISEEFGTFTVRGKAQKDTSKPAGEEFYTVRPL